MEFQPAITLVDPDAQRRSQLSGWLASAGYQVSESASPSNLEIPNHGRRHCFLMAESAVAPLLGIDGANGAPRLGSPTSELLRTAPVVAMLETLEPHTLLRALRVGLADVIGWPVTKRELLDSIQRALELDAERQAQKSARHQASQRLQALSKRERQVLHGILLGHSNQRIGEGLEVSVKTIESHRSNLMKKARCRSLACLVRLAVLAGEGDGCLVPPLDS